MPRLAIAAALCLVAAACGSRATTDAVPDRKGHALEIGGPVQASNTAPVPSQGGGPAGAGEESMVFKDGDRLYRIAEQKSVSLEWLIRRNDITTHPVTPGTALVVPAK